MKNKVFPVKFLSINVCDSEPLWKQFFWFAVFEYDETPYGFLIRVLGIDVEFSLGKWE